MSYSLHTKKKEEGTSFLHYEKEAIKSGAATNTFEG